MQHPILALLQEASARVERAERKIVDAERERALARIEMAAYEKAARAVGLYAEVAKAAHDIGLATDPKRTRGAKVTSASSAWISVFQRLNRTNAEGFGYDEIAHAADSLNVLYQRASLRTKMMNYVNDGAIERVGNGRFRITHQGRSVFEIDAAQNENGEAKASPDAGEAATSPDDGTGAYKHLFS